MTVLLSPYDYLKILSLFSVYCIICLPDHLFSSRVQSTDQSSI